MNRFRPTRRLRRLGLAATGLLAPLGMASMALAQSADDFAAPTPEIKGGFPVWLAYLVMFVLAVIVISVALYPSKRSHQE
ncbi:MAG: hypothetical protein AB8G96_08670 [Phycisphaerales bacterium]